MCVAWKLFSGQKGDSFFGDTNPIVVKGSPGPVGVPGAPGYPGQKGTGCAIDNLFIPS